ncbi:36147_t:CDS:2, partial [Racocetra persica]
MYEQILYQEPTNEMYSLVVKVLNKEVEIEEEVEMQVLRED